MAGRVGFYSHEALSFPTGSGTSEASVSLPNVDLWDSIPSQSSVESCTWDTVYPQESNLLATSTQVTFNARSSLFFTDLSDR